MKTKWHNPEYHEPEEGYEPAPTPIGITLAKWGAFLILGSILIAEAARYL